MQESFVYVPPGRRPVGGRMRAAQAVGCPLLVWQWPDGVWCWLDQLWHWQYRHKAGGWIEPWHQGF